MGQRAVVSVLGALAVAGGCAATAVVPPAPRQEPAAPPAVRAADPPMAPETDPPAAPADPWRAAAAIGEHHRHLDAFAGEWTVTSRHWPTPEAEPTQTGGTMSGRLILEGRFVQLAYAGELVGEDGAGVPFSGLGLIGYDNLEQWHVALWMDTLSTAVIAQQGVCDAEGGRLTLTGSFTDPATGERRTLRTLYRFEGPDRFVLEQHLPDAEGREYRALEVVHERRH